ncbi:hypothetical protein [Chryseobacterium sp. CCH4-E10]|uniref:hypothetical protein n=1 Tax=Chryseobacterium sp. CCH4-E10 TaxID=1768758 RepID=UPI0012FB71D9|nr:hypothetical protein [Chryseobacterium sp. CCH4-E10]
MNYSDPTGMIGESIGDPGGPNPNKIYGPKGGYLIEEIVLKGVRKSNAMRSLIRVSLHIDKGFDDGIMDYTKGSYNFVTKNAYSKSYWQKKGGEALMTAAYLSDMNKIRADGSSNAMDVFNSIRNASAYDIGQFTGYNSAQFAITTVFTEGGGILLNIFKITPKISLTTLSRQEMAGIWEKEKVLFMKITTKREVQL